MRDSPVVGGMIVVGVHLRRVIHPPVGCVDPAMRIPTIIVTPLGHFSSVDQSDLRKAHGNSARWIG